MVNGEQITVQFHVDDLKVSHKDETVLEDFLTNLRDEFGQEDELTENKGLVHEYLGMTIEYSSPRKVVFTMFDYLEDVIVEADKDLKNSRLYYPGNNSRMKVDCDSTSLLTKDAVLFYCHAVRLVFASNRARPEIQALCSILVYNGKSTNRTRLQETWKSHQLLEGNCTSTVSCRSR